MLLTNENHLKRKLTGFSNGVRFNAKNNWKNLLNTNSLTFVLSLSYHDSRARQPINIHKPCRFSEIWSYSRNYGGIQVGGEYYIKKGFDGKCKIGKFYSFHPVECTVGSGVSLSMSSSRDFLRVLETEKFHERIHNCNFSGWPADRNLSNFTASHEVTEYEYDQVMGFLIKCEKVIPYNYCWALLVYLSQMFPSG